MKSLLIVVLLLGVICAAINATKNNTPVRYDGHRVYRIFNASQAQLNLLFSHQPEFDIWRRSPESVDVMLSPDSAPFLAHNGFNSTVMIDNVQELIDEQSNEFVTANSWYEEYHTSEAIVAQLKFLAATKPSLVTFNPSIGTSIEGRSIVSISLSAAPASPSTPQIIIISGQHAREWIAPAATMYIIQQLIDGYGTDTEVTSILNRSNITFVPMVNPDGYDFSWTTTRLWRKNRRRNVGGTFGVDLNRNWGDAHWCQFGASKDPSSDTYCGTAPFSEPESTAVSNLILKLAAMDNKNTAVKLMMDMHAYSQLLLRPYGWTTTLPPNGALLKTLSANMASLIRGVHGKVYQSISAAELYPSTGSDMDWAYEKANVPVIYAPELRDTGVYGFLLPANQILPQGQELWAAVEYLLYTVITN